MNISHTRTYSNPPIIITPTPCNRHHWNHVAMIKNHIKANNKNSYSGRAEKKGIKKFHPFMICSSCSNTYRISLVVNADNVLKKIYYDFSTVFPPIHNSQHGSLKTWIWDSSLDLIVTFLFETLFNMYKWKFQIRWISLQR